MRFPDNSSPESHEFAHDVPAPYDMRGDQANNRLMLDTDASHPLRTPGEEPDDRAAAHGFTNIKRRDMGAALPDKATAMFLSRSSAVIGSSLPTRHDGRAHRLDKAIPGPGGEAAEHSAT